MRKVIAFVRALVAAAALALAGPVLAQQAPGPEAEWQAVITSQIDAFRQKDASAAFLYASAPFHDSFPSAAAFFAAIISSGYGPIMDSASHSFGPFELDPGGTEAIQLVRLVGLDQQLYEAIYNLTREPEGWRVSGVMLRTTAGVGV